MESPTCLLLETQPKLKSVYPWRTYSSFPLPASLPNIQPTLLNRCSILIVKCHYSKTLHDSYLPKKIQSKLENFIFLPFINRLSICILHITTFSGLLHIDILIKPYQSLNMTHTFSFLHPYSLNIPYLPCLPHLYLFTYSINTIKYLPYTRACAYQGTILPLDCLESGLLKSYDSFKVGPYATTSMGFSLLSWTQVTA